MVHRKLLKSSFVRIPVPKNSAMGMMAITPMSPKIDCSWWLTHHNTMVARVTSEMNHWMPVNLSLIGRMGTIVVPRSGRNVRRSRSQIRTILMMQTGSAMKNHTPQPGWGFMFCNAIKFWGLAMGDAAPPMLDARAIPRRRARDMGESEGRFLRIGWFQVSKKPKVVSIQPTWMMEKQSTGAATLLIHMLANMATNMDEINTVRGLVPALLSTKVAMIFAILYLDKAAAIVNPPSSNIMTGVHMAAKTYVAAGLDSSRRWGLSSDLATRRTTTRKGTMSDVTNKGIASVAQRRLTNTTSARQFCCSGFFMIGTSNSTKKMAMITTRV